jgi:hypothetical protein
VGCREFQPAPEEKIWPSTGQVRWSTASGKTSTILPCPENVTLEFQGVFPGPQVTDNRDQVVEGASPFSWEPEILAASRAICGPIAPLHSTRDRLQRHNRGPLSSAAATDTAKSAIADADQYLKSLFKKKFGHYSNFAEAIEKLEEKADSGGRRQTAIEELQVINSTSDPELVSAAQSLFRVIRPPQAKTPGFAQDIGITQADRGSAAAVTMHPHGKDD